MEPILQGSKVVMSGHTLSANPQSCATSLAVLEYLEQNKIVQGVFEKSQYLESALKQLQSRFSFIGDVRGKGLLIGLEFVQNPQSKAPFPRSLAFTQKVIKSAVRNGLLLYPAGAGIDGIHGDAIIIAPPLTITVQEMDVLIEKLTMTCSELEKMIGKGGYGNE